MLNTYYVDYGCDDHMYNNCVCHPTMAHKCDYWPLHKESNNNNNRVFICKTSMAINDVVGCKTTAPFAGRRHYISCM